MYNTTFCLRSVCFPNNVFITHTLTHSHAHTRTHAHTVTHTMCMHACMYNRIHTMSHVMGDKHYLLFTVIVNSSESKLVLYAAVNLYSPSSSGSTEDIVIPTRPTVNLSEVNSTYRML